MEEGEAQRLFEKGLHAFAQGNTLSALSFFERAVQLEETPLYCSYYAYCVARERGQFQLAVTLCEKAKAKEPDRAIHYLNLGKVYLLAGKKPQAIDVFREGMRYEENQDIVKELSKIGPRKPPAIPFLRRENPINKYLGIVLARLRLR